MRGGDRHGDSWEEKGGVRESWWTWRWLSGFNVSSGPLRTVFMPNLAQQTPTIPSDVYCTAVPQTCTRRRSGTCWPSCRTGTWRGRASAASTRYTRCETPCCGPSWCGRIFNRWQAFTTLHSILSTLDQASCTTAPSPTLLLYPPPCRRLWSWPRFIVWARAWREWPGLRHRQGARDCGCGGGATRHGGNGQGCITVKVCVVVGGGGA